MSTYGGPDSAFGVHCRSHLMTLIHGGHDRDSEKTISIRVTHNFSDVSTVDRNVNRSLLLIQRRTNMLGCQ